MNSAILDLVNRGRFRQALHLYHKFAEDPPPADGSTFMALLKACAQLRDFHSGCQIHADIVRTGLLHRETYVGNKLVDMYAKCGALVKAHEVFEMLPVRDVVSWNAVIAAYTGYDLYMEALICFEQMQLEGIVPSAFTFVYILKAHIFLDSPEGGGKIHSEIVRMGYLGKDLVVSNAILDTYAKFGFITKAREVFDTLRTRDRVSWTALISGYANHQQGMEALELFNRMLLEGVIPNDHTFVCSLKACGSIGFEEKGKLMHVLCSIEGKLDENVLIANTLINMYGKCGLLSKAEQVFNGIQAKDIISWNSVIAAYAEHEHGKEALNFLEKMLHEGFTPDDVTYVISLKSCTGILAIEKAMELHADLTRKGFSDRDILVRNTLVDVYCKLNMLAEAQQVFDSATSRDLVSWTALLSGYMRHSLTEETLHIFERMNLEGFSPNAVTYACILRACSISRNIVKGNQIHADIARKGFLTSDVEVVSELIEMYIKCGFPRKAKEVLYKLPIRNTVAWNAVIIGYVMHEYNAETLKSFVEMQHDGFLPNFITFVHTLKACASIGSIDEGREIHSTVVKRGQLERQLILTNSLVYMYSKSGLFEEAQEIVKNLSIRDVASWTGIISGYLYHDQSEEALKCFEMMQEDGTSPTVITYSCMLKACGNTGNIEMGRHAHVEISRKGMLETDHIIGNALIDMYIKCGFLSKAKEVFDKLAVPDVISWNILIGGYTMYGQGEEAFICFEQMQHEMIYPTAVTFLSALKACGIILSTEKGKEVHSQIAKIGLLETDNLVGNALVDMYGRCGLITEAQAVFDHIVDHNVITWTALISAYAKSECGEKALDLYKQMQQEGLCPNSLTYICIMKSCGSIIALEKGIELHSQIDTGMLLEDTSIGNSIMDMYTKCGSPARAHQVFDRLWERNSVSWNILIVGYAVSGCFRDVLNCYKLMQLEGVHPSSLSIICSLKACGFIPDIKRGRELHEEIIENKLLETNVSVGNALIGMYIHCGFLLEGWKVFNMLPIRNEITWITLLSGYRRSELPDGTVSCDGHMLLEVPSKDVAVLALEETMERIDYNVERSITKSNLISSSILLDLYAEHGFLPEAQRLFDRLPVHDVVPWTSLMAGYLKHEHFEEALNCYDHMQLEGIFPDVVTFLCILKACGSIGIPAKGREIHAHIIKKGLSDKDLLIGNALIDMYAKCGMVAKSFEVLERLPIKDVISWTALISGYVETGDSKQVFHTFEKMRCDGIEPDSVTFATVLTACCKQNLTDNGCIYFEEMSTSYGLRPGLSHYTSIIDLLVHSGNFNQAICLVRQLPVHPDLILWNTMMNACLKSGNFGLGGEISMQWPFLHIKS